MQSCRSGSEIRFFYILDPDPDSGSSTHISETLLKKFLFKNTVQVILCQLAKNFKYQYLFKNKIIYNLVKFMATKEGRTTSFSPSLHCYCWIRDPRSGSAILLHV
jgi:hypothetical protein